MLRRFDMAKRALLAMPRSYSRLAQASPNIATMNDSDKYRQGEILHGFVVEEIGRINEMYLDAIRLTHMKTGAQYLHLNRDDSNNVFSIGLRTTPMNSTGVPHILEHMSLCGSKRYPVRDPFMKMLRRSLATFINAMTGMDYTIYPFSTQNQKDFRNLQSVYADAVFQPFLRELDFLQEGWRLEHTDPNDKNTPIIFKGVVFNEMKGVFNENQWIFAEKLLNLILPSHTYSVCSGGLPLVIPELTHKALKEFHDKYYHPSNSRIFSYGNFPLEDHLKFMDERYLSLSNKIDTTMSIVPSEKRWTAPKREHITCRNDPLAPDPQRQGTFAIGHLCNDITDIQSTLEMNIISELLLKGPNSAFYKSLIESNIGSGFGSLTGYDSHAKDTIFAVSLQGVNPDDFEKIERVYDETLDRVIDQGFEKDHIEAVLHGIEMRIKHQTSDFGINLLFNITPLWNHNGDVIRSLRINDAMDSFVLKIKNDPQYLSKLVDKYLRSNKHRLILTMSPDENYDSKLAAEEENLLKNKLEKLTNDELNEIYNSGQILRADQEKKEDTDILPTLKVTDLKEDVDRYIYNDVQVDGVPLQVSVQPTNNITYYRGILNTRELDTNLKNLIPIFTDVIAKMGTKSHDYRSFDRLCQLKTGGLSFCSHIAEKKDCINTYEEGIFISSYCLDRNADDMWELWTELFNEAQLDDIKRFETLVKSNAGDLSNGIADCGHVYAMSSAAGLISPAGKLKESLGGLEFIGRMKKIAQEKDLSPLLENIREIRDQIMNKIHFRTAINLSEDNKGDVIQGLHGFYGSLNGECNSEAILYTNKQLSGLNESGIHYVMPYATNYTSKAILTVPYNDPDYAPLRILAKLVSSLYLLPEVREKEGAYGSGANISAEGAFTYYSFRDPNSTKTFDTFDKTWEFFESFKLNQRDLDEAKLGVFQKIDAPVAPGSRGMLRFIHGLSDDDVQIQRMRLKDVTIDDVIRVAEKYLKPQTEGIKVGRAIIGPANSDLLERKSENWEVISPEKDN
ncbi:hypothetical protein PV327_008953 [Microctonus hyperodae]|uniref:Presequence protease, mitochondrial n=1 Tax=Microctonus hyperodae TaxID=165561 RepID=A0AA39KVD8_MICHY|nr:hypothetical protein PV327_008953 [Microctonus hyperodae]